MRMWFRRMGEIAIARGMKGWREGRKEGRKGRELVSRGDEGWMVWYGRGRPGTWVVCVAVLLFLLASLTLFISYCHADSSIEDALVCQWDQSEER